MEQQQQQQQQHHHHNHHHHHQQQQQDQLAYEEPPPPPVAAAATTTTTSVVLPAVAQDQVSVKVAVRIRPQVSREKIDLYQICTTVTPNEPQVWLGKDKAFTFDHVFDTDSQQQAIYDACVRDLVEGCFNGYNATVLAYGQTGSGKTYTMGTGFELPTDFGTIITTSNHNYNHNNHNNDNNHHQHHNHHHHTDTVETEDHHSDGTNHHSQPPLTSDLHLHHYNQQHNQQQTINSNHGIIPRAVQHLFDGIEMRKNEALAANLPPPEFKVTAQFIELYNEEIIDLFSEGNGSKSTNNHIKIHEDNGSISITGVTSKNVSSAEEAFESLRYGALSRTTASTQMNTQSSRSHAIFTLLIKQNRITADESQELESLSAKFHFVDLAGSERLKRTGATGDRAKEGISINSGLLCLGNVISALGDKSKRATHIPYRDSKLTRLLQDSLGGNSQTLMIACISPSDRDFMETLSTLRYANRAKNIRNRVTANHDTANHTIAMLRKQIQNLQLELLEIKQGKRVIYDDGSEQINDMYHENAMLLNEIHNLKTRVKALREANERLVTRNAEIISEKEYALWSTNEADASPDVKDIVQRYLKEIEELRLKLMEMEETCSVLRKQVQRHNQITGRLSMMSNGTHEDLEVSSDKVIEEAKREVKKLKAYTKLIVHNGLSDNNVSMDVANGQSLDLPNDLEESGEGSGSDEEGDSDSSEETSEKNSDESIEAAKIELDELNDNITTKEKLIAELEKSQRKMQSLKHHYESKLIQLQNQITEIERERDQVMAKLNQSGPNEKTRRLNEDYDKKIKTLQNDVKKLQEAKREHASAMRSQARYEQQIKKLRVDVDDMKRQKVNVMNKMKEEAQRHREMELCNSKKIAQLIKQDRLKDIRIRNLEVENNRVKQFLKRRDAEVKALKTKHIILRSILLQQYNNNNNTNCKNVPRFRLGKYVYVAERT